MNYSILLLAFAILTNTAINSYFTQSEKHKISYKLDFKTDDDDSLNTHIVIDSLYLQKLNQFYFKCLDNAINNQNDYVNYLVEYTSFEYNFEKQDGKYHKNDKIIKTEDSVKVISGSVDYWEYITVYVKDSMLLRTDVPKMDELTWEYLYNEYGNPIYEVKYYLVSLKDVANKICFDEKWSYDKNGKFSKQIDGILLGTTHNYYTTAALVSNKKKSKNLVLSNVVYDVNIMSSFPKIDEKGYTVNTLYIDGRKDLINTIFDNFHGDNLKIYHADIKEGEEYKVINSDEIENLTSYTIKYKITNEFGQYEYDQNGNVKINETKFYYKNHDITGFRFIEDWYFDSKTMNFTKEVKYFGPIVGDYELSSEDHVEKVLFLIKN